MWPTVMVVCDMVTPNQVSSVAHMVLKILSGDGSVSPRSSSNGLLDIFDSKTLNFLKTQEAMAMRSDQTSESSCLVTKLLLLSSLF